MIAIALHSKFFFHKNSLHICFSKFFSKRKTSLSYVDPFKRKVKPSDVIVNESRIANRICITILGNGAVGQPCCVGLFTDLKSYFFNCGEGVGRLCREYDIDMLAVKHIFVTQKKWKNMSGLADVYTSNRIHGVFSLFLHGPPGIEHFLSVVTSCKSYFEMTRKANVDSYIDHTLQVHYVPIKNKYDKENSAQKETSSDVYSYICEIFEKPGEFLVEKCVEYGVPVGPELLKLKNGESISLPSGRKVHPSNVHTSPFPGAVLFFVDCPSESYLDSFVTEPKFEKYLFPENSAMEVAYVFHFTPKEVLQSFRYQKWMDRFHQSTRHFVLNYDNPTASSAVIHRTHGIFQHLHPNIFCVPKEKKVSYQEMGFKNSIIYTPPLLQLHLRPEKNLSWANVVDVTAVDDDETLAIKNSNSFQDMLRNLKASLNSNLFSKGTNKVYPEVVFLGTSSSASTAYRNVSCILINTSLMNSILLDCGEGTVTQLIRYYGHQNYHLALRNISCVFISHKHTDHYLGMFELLRYRKESFETLGVPYRKVVVIMPYDVENILKKFCEIFEPINSLIRLFKCRYVKEERKHVLKKFIGDFELFTVPVNHCNDSHAAVIQSKEGWKIVYSGDTAPCQKLIEAGKDCTILIHEASIEDSMVNEASAKLHSTPSQVIETAEKMNAQYTIMTHFSKRYLAIPVLPEYNSRHVAYAYDFMKVRLCDWPILPLFTPAMKNIFQEQLESHSEKTSYVSNFETAFFKTVKS